MQPPRGTMTWPEALARAGSYGHEMDEEPAPADFAHMARCRRCGGLILAISETDAFGEPAQHLCTPRQPQEPPP